MVGDTAPGGTWGGGTVLEFPPLPSAPPSLIPQEALLGSQERWAVRFLNHGTNDKPSQKPGQDVRFRLVDRKLLGTGLLI